jgi:hypothetical protein
MMHPTQASYAVALAEYEAACHLAAQDMPADPPEGASDAALDAWAEACAAAHEAHVTPARRAALAEAEDAMMDWAIAHVPGMDDATRATVPAIRASAHFRPRLVDLCFRLDASEVTR